MAAPASRAVARRSLINSLIRRRGIKNIYHNSPCKIRCYCSATDDFTGGSRDVGSLFMHSEVQNLLTKITGFDLDKIFSMRPTADYEKPKYKLMTAKQLQEVQDKAIDQGKEFLQMPPALSQTDGSCEILSEDSQLEGLHDTNFVFTDITYGLPDRSRTVVVREPSGQLRKANIEERDRMLQIFHPTPGRMIKMPEMFKTERLEELLSEEKYLYIMDRACVQFEPENPEYHRVVHRTYEKICDQHHFDYLRSTRHFGGMVFYFVLHKNIEPLLVDMIQRDMLEEASDVVRIMHIVHPTTKSAMSSKTLTDPLEIVQKFLEEDSPHAGVVELALQTYKEAQEQLHERL